MIAWIVGTDKRPFKALYALYESAGYRRFAVHRGYYDDGADAFRYEKRLGGAATRLTSPRPAASAR